MDGTMYRCNKCSANSQGWYCSSTADSTSCCKWLPHKASSAWLRMQGDECLESGHLLVFVTDHLRVLALNRNSQVGDHAAPVSLIPLTMSRNMAYQGRIAYFGAVQQC